MHLTRISELLAPFLTTPLSEAQLAQIAAYLEILHRWNARMNLTAIRDPEQMVTRHFGESLFAAQQLFPSRLMPRASRLFDIGSGAGFPGLPMKIWATELDVTLVESQARKATFLKEVIRALELTDLNVLNSRVEDVVRNVGSGARAGAALERPQSSTPADAPSAAPHVTVTLRAVEKFDRVLPVAAQLASRGRLALLIGSPQVELAHSLAPAFRWADTLLIPHSLARVLLIGESS